MYTIIVFCWRSRTFFYGLFLHGPHQTESNQEKKGQTGIESLRVTDAAGHPNHIPHTLCPFTRSTAPNALAKHYVPNLTAVKKAPAIRVAKTDPNAAV